MKKEKNKKKVQKNQSSKWRYRLTCCKCGTNKVTNYQSFIKKKKANTLNKHTCRECQKKEKSGAFRRPKGKLSFMIC